MTEPKRSKPELRDDGTMDTVIACPNCGEEARYTFIREDEETTYDDYVQSCIDDFDSEHECDETIGDA